MPGLADAILDAKDIEDEIENIEDEELVRELEKVRELREALNSSHGSRPNSSALPSLGASDSRPLVAPDREGLSSRGGAHIKDSDGQAPKSLADQINGADDVEREFEAMEQELQEQLVKYKAQCEGAELVQSPTAERVAPAIPLVVPEASSTSTSSLRPSSCKTSVPNKEQPSSCPPDSEEPTGEVITPELLELREEAAKMEEAFPAAESNADELPRRKRITRTRDNKRGEIPEDPEIIDLTRLLGSLDERLGSIQEKHGACDVLERESGYASNVISSKASKVISDMRAQNAHLRERFQSSNKRGVLGLDASMFGAVESHPKVAQA